MQINVAELDWKDVKKYIYSPNGSLPDTYVLDTTRADWETWTNFVNATYRVIFRDAYEQEHEKIDFAAVLQCWDKNETDGWPFASVFVGNIQVNCFFLAEDAIDGDIDTKQFEQANDHLGLMEYLTSLSKLLKKRVVLVEEGTRLEANNHFDPAPIIIVDHDIVVANAYWLDASK
ncbi:hypothetical protein [Hymenobacter wooponensis]|uniref:Uncharacterized protein n=1 Tax=Hymenobacter wooponensis TaxID=1525360 RepID=A0A4Z0MRP3_9BACT|nr:hypothetical protein [Hymenobacter wooponensis]TGD82493.1 hypothetical protein EU557_01520 [Hymenobacter wooponensis]